MSPKRSSSRSSRPQPEQGPQRAGSKRKRGRPAEKASAKQALNSAIPPALERGLAELGLHPDESSRMGEVLQALVLKGLIRLPEENADSVESTRAYVEPTQVTLQEPSRKAKKSSATPQTASEDVESSASSEEVASPSRPKRPSQRPGQRPGQRPDVGSARIHPKAQSRGTFPSEVKGILRKHPRGFGFVAPMECPSIQEVFIPKGETAGAMDGDLVTVRIAAASFASPKGPEGEVIAVLERSREHLMGFVMNSCQAWVRGLEDGEGILEMRVPQGLKLREADRVLLRMEQWPDAESDLEGVAVVERVLGSLEDPSADIECAIAEFGLQSEFDPTVLGEAKQWGDRVMPRDIEGREDLREVECLTIDPTTAKDFDDAISIVKTSKGSFHLGVHIADVAYYVQAGSALDREARRRCNSTYFPGRCVPMLPHELSDNLCSLKPEVNRLAVTVFMEFSADGEMTRYRIARSVIRSAKRFTYEEALEVLEGKKRSKYKSSLERMVELCGLLKKKRAERGSVELALSDVQVRVDANGVPTGLERHEYDVTHQMVEEFMLKANEVVAAHLTKQGKPVAYRIHEQPSESDLKEFVSTARALGYKIPLPPTSQDLQSLFAAAKASPHASQLAVSFIKSMKLAFYSPDNVGHYGLGLDHYCHFTSPIRRYPDLIAQRALFGETEANLSEMTEACSEQERRSSRAEESVVRLKKLRLLKSWLDADPMRAFPAVITRVKPNGVTFELTDLMLEGFLHVRGLGNDFYHFQERHMAFHGERTGEVFAYGQTISVTIDHLNLMTGEIRWAMVGASRPDDHDFDTEPAFSDATQPRKKRSSKRRRRHARD